MVLPKALTIAPFDFNPLTGEFGTTGSLFDLPAIVMAHVLVLAGQPQRH